MSYEYENYDNIKQLEKIEPKLANELKQRSWKEDKEIMVFPNKSEFAKFKVDFWLEVIDWGSIVDPLKYIDFNRLADDLIKKDSSLYYTSNDGRIIY